MRDYTLSQEKSQAEEPGTQIRGTGSDSSQPLNPGQTGPSAFLSPKLALERKKLSQNADENAPRGGSLDSTYIKSAFLEGRSSVTIENTGVASHKWITLFCSRCGFVYHFKSYCGDRLCPECRKRRFWNLYQAYLRIFKGRSNLVHLVLTLKNLKYFDKSAVKEIRKNFDQLRRQKFWAPVKGGMYVVQVSEKGKGWHLHLHVIFESKVCLSQKVISEHWQDISGSRIVFIKRVKNQRVLRYVLRDLFQEPRVRKESLETWGKVFSKVRMVHTFGSWFGLKPEEYPVECPSCGNTVWMSEFELNGYLRNLESSRAPPD